MNRKNRDEKDSPMGIKFETGAAATAGPRQEIHETLQESVLEMKTRNKILEIFHTTPDDQVYGELLELVLEVFKSKFGTFGYFDREGHFVIPSMTREIYWQKCRVPDKEIIFKKGTFTGIDVREYFSSIITQLNKAYGALQRLINIDVKVDNVPLPLAFVIPCGLILNELLTNAFKHAFPGAQTGEIIVEFHKNNNRFELSVGDNGVGLPDRLDFREAETMGLRLINILTRQLKGEINLDQSKGTLFKITFTAKGEKGGI